DPSRRGVPLSFAQQRLWFVDQFQPGSPTYNLPSPVRVSGRLDRAVLARSLNEIVRRHEALRTTLRNAGGQPVQEIAPALELALPLIELRGLAPARRESEARRLATTEARRPFDLCRGPLLRATVVRIADEDHAVLLTMHHIVSDGWSMGVLTRELAALHTAFFEGAPSPLDELPIQYADHAVWQRQWLTGEVLEEELEYWRLKLAGAPRLRLPTDRPRPALQSSRGSSRPVVLSRDLSASLEALSRRLGVTLFMTLLAGFQTLLARHTGQEDISVGSPIAGRNRKEIESLIGFFVNTLVLRTDLSAVSANRDPSFRRLLVEVRQAALDGYAHQNLPFERLVEELQPERDLSTTPLFQVMFVLQNAPREPLRISGLTLTPLATEWGTANFDLTLALVESESGILGGLEYNTDLFDTTTMDRLFAHYEHLLEGVVGDPEKRLSELPWLAPGERHQLLVDWNDTGGEASICPPPGEPPEQRSIHELFESRAQRIPAAVALVVGDRRLSYGELNRRADRLASSLRSLGVGPETVVGLCARRSFGMLEGMLGILKAGGIYLPLDPGIPRQRLAFMLEDSGAAVLVTAGDASRDLPAGGRPVVAVEEAAQAQQPELPGHRVSPEQGFFAGRSWTQT
ncbi:MAG: AMP-binding protein, partial [bacterium]|nr:AMP-binding protein [bacterium]